MSALSIRNMNWTVGQMEIIRDSAVSKKSQCHGDMRKDSGRNDSRSIPRMARNHIHDNATFTAQADAMWEQINQAQELAASVTLNWQAAFLILDMCEGTEASPIISGGEILQPEYAEANAVSDAFNFKLVQEIPF